MLWRQPRQRLMESFRPARWAGRIGTMNLGISGFQFQVSGFRFMGRRTDGLLVWALRGQPGSRYVVEKADLVENRIWRAFAVLTKTTGTVTFTDSVDPDLHASFYRARILD